VANYGIARQDTEDNVARRIHIECRITKATDEHQESVVIIIICGIIIIIIIIKCKE